MQEKKDIVLVFDIGYKNAEKIRMAVEALPIYTSQMCWPWNAKYIPFWDHYVVPLTALPLMNHQQPFLDKFKAGGVWNEREGRRRWSKLNTKKMNLDQPIFLKVKNYLDFLNN